MFVHKIAQFILSIFEMTQNPTPSPHSYSRELFSAQTIKVHFPYVGFPILSHAKQLESSF